MEHSVIELESTLMQLKSSLTKRGHSFKDKFNQLRVTHGKPNLHKLSLEISPIHLKMSSIYKRTLQLILELSYSISEPFNPIENLSYYNI